MCLFLANLHTVRIVRSYAPAWEVFYCSFVETVCEGVGLCVAFAGVAGPAGGGVPAGAVAGGVDVDTDEEDVGGALGCADGVGAADAFFEGDVFGFGDEELGVVAFGLEGCEDLVGEVAGVGVFEEGAVWGAFAGGVVAVGGVQEDEHGVEATARGFRGRR